MFRPRDLRVDPAEDREGREGRDDRRNARDGNEEPVYEAETEPDPERDQCDHFDRNAVMGLECRRDEIAGEADDRADAAGRCSASSITSVSPTATTATIETFCAIPCQFPAVKKFVARTPKKMTTAMSAIRMPISRSRNAAAASSCGFMPAHARQSCRRLHACRGLDDPLLRRLLRDSSATSCPSRMTRMRSLIRGFRAAPTR